MTRINSFEDGINSLEEDLYIRAINEFRIEFENNVLYYLVNHLLSKKKINSEYLKSEVKYLNKLCERYYIKKIKLKINSEKENRIVDEILILIKRAKKAIDYSYLDIADFYYKQSNYFTKLKLNKNFSIILKDILVNYNHNIPKKISKAPKEEIISKNKSFSGENFKEFKSKIYQNFSKALKISIDKFFLKIYDYLIETDLKEINSPKMYFLKKDFVKIGKKYSKLKYNVKIRNKIPKNIKDCFLDEVAANLFRVKEIFIYND